MRILGIDPGLQCTGFGVIDVDGPRLHYVASGTITTSPRDGALLPGRLKVLFDGITEVVGRYQPQVAACEIVFVNVNPQATLLLGQARGCCVTALAAHPSRPTFAGPSARSAARVLQACVTPESRAENPAGRGSWLNDPVAAGRARPARAGTLGLLQTPVPCVENRNRLKLQWVLYTVVPLTCLTIGFYDGFFGPGTGSMFIIAFHYLLRMDLVSSSANSKTFNFASNIGALVAFIMAGKVVYLLALPLVACNILGNHMGSALALRKGNDVVRKVLVFSMLCLFTSLGVKYLT